jgi:hypothetical protein
VAPQVGPVQVLPAERRLRLGADRQRKNPVYVMVYLHSPTDVYWILCRTTLLDVVWHVKIT